MRRLLFRSPGAPAFGEVTDPPFKVEYYASRYGQFRRMVIPHPVPVKAPDGIEFEVPQPTRIVVKGVSKQRVGEVAAYIRKQRKPEPYKGKGIRYEGEYVARKVGKRA